MIVVRDHTCSRLRILASTTVVVGITAYHSVDSSLLVAIGTLPQLQLKTQFYNSTILFQLTTCFFHRTLWLDHSNPVLAI